MKAIFIREKIEFNRSGNSIKGMDIGIRKDPKTPKIIGISYFNPKVNDEYVLEDGLGNQFLESLLKGNIKDPHLYSLIDKDGKQYNVWQYPPNGLLDTTFLYNNNIYIIPRDILYESISFERG